jgi:acyl-CoA synthetase (AMP-forming)/AMP-acid ligase II/acyl carrier protein
MTNYFDDIHKLTTLVELLRYRAKKQPDRTAYIFLQDGESESGRLTYQELEQQARAIAVSLQSIAKKGDRTLMLYPSGPEFITAFLGCLYAGVIPVPAYPPRQNQNLLRLQAIIADAEATVVLTTESLLDSIKTRFAQNPEFLNLRWLATDSVPQALASDWQEVELSGDTLAFLQYTSGSTGTPKGVMVSHTNLVHNERLIQMGFGHTEKTIFVGWLPLFHDMGLIGNVLQPLYLGIPSILMPPVAFLQKPVRWLQAISRYKATTSGGPNFAYDLCVRKITPEMRAELDLRSWEIAYNGAEPIRAETLEQFATTFAECGFRRQAFYPCYGMAETTLFVSGTLKTALPVLYPVEATALEQNQIVPVTADKANARTIVGCGQTFFDKIAIVDPQTKTRCPSDRVGEIWIAGQSVAQGYWNRPEQTQETFQACLADGDRTQFLRTGDLGFFQNGELFITGRLKDVIIIRGRNHYPQDIELTVEKSHPALRSNCAAAFSVDINGSEQLVVACEIERTALRKLDIDAVVGAIRKAVSQEHELQVHAIVLLKTASIPKTSSGKIQRQACKTGFLEGTLEVVGDWTAANIPALPKKQLSESKESRSAQAIENWMVNWLSKELKLELSAIEPSKSFADYGLDSVAAVELAQALGDWLGGELDATIAWNFPTIKALAVHLAQEPTAPQQPKRETPSSLNELAGVASSLDTLSEIEIAKLLAQELAAVQQR